MDSLIEGPLDVAPDAGRAAKGPVGLNLDSLLDIILSLDEATHAYKSVMFVKVRHISDDASSQGGAK